MDEDHYTVITTDAVDILWDNIELVLFDNRLTDDGYTYFNADLNEVIERAKMSVIQAITAYVRLMETCQ